MSRRWKIALWIGGAGLAAFVAVTAVATVEVSRHAREWVVGWLSRRYQSSVDLDSFQISIYPRIQVVGDNLAVHFEGRSDIPPLISVRRFVLRANPIGLLRNPRHVDTVRLEGLAINIPPRQANQPGATVTWGKAAKSFRSASFTEIVADNAMLTILTANPARQPLIFDIEHLVLHPLAFSGRFAFQATLTNPTPPGEIISSGEFGPWLADAPSLTPVSGTYTFDGANLGIFPGIAGVLSAKGSYQGILDHIESDGETEVPDFRLTRAGHPVDLKTTYHAIVDGTDGDTYLDPVVAHFLKTTLTARGKVEGVKGQPGKTIALDVSADQARLEDLLQLAVSEPAAISGPIQLKTTFLLPHGMQDILDRLNLNGNFDLPSAHFTDGSVQQKFDNLSKRGRGDARDVLHTPDPSDDVASAMTGDFALAKGLLVLTNLTFQMPGAELSLNGTYNLDAELLDLHGHLSMDAKLSHTTTGVKSFFLRTVDPFFSKNGKGTVLPIKVVGSVKQPTYGLDFHHKESTRISPP